MAKITKIKEPPKKYYEVLHAELEQDKKEGKHYGFATDDDAIKFPEKISTGSLALDIALEGGYRCGWSRFSGEPQMGKTAQGLCWGAHWQQQFKDDAFVICFNAEGRITADLLRRSGIDAAKERFLRLDAHDGNYIADKILSMVTHNPFGKRFFFLTDSTDALILAGDKAKTSAEAAKVGGGATLLSYLGKQLSLPIAVLGHHLYITSQLRDKVNTGGGKSGGSKESGGNAPKYYSSISGRMKTYYVGSTNESFIRQGSDNKSPIIGRRTLLELYKSPNEAQNEVLLHVKYGQTGGIWREAELVYLLQIFGWLERNGSWFNPTEDFGDELVKEKIFEEPFAVQGELGTIKFVEQNPKFLEYATERLKANSPGF